MADWPRAAVELLWFVWNPAGVGRMRALVVLSGLPTTRGRVDVRVKVHHGVDQHSFRPERATLGWSNAATQTKISIRISPVTFAKIEQRLCVVRSTNLRGSSFRDDFKPKLQISLLRYFAINTPIASEATNVRHG